LQLRALPFRIGKFLLQLDLDLILPLLLPQQRLELLLQISLHLQRLVDFLLVSLVLQLLHLDELYVQLLRLLVLYHHLLLQLIESILEISIALPLFLLRLHLVGYARFVLLHQSLYHLVAALDLQSLLVEALELFQLGCLLLAQLRTQSSHLFLQLQQLLVLLAAQVQLAELVLFLKPPQRLDLLLQLDVLRLD